MNLSLKFKIDGPEVLGSVDLSKVKSSTKPEIHKCLMRNKVCSNERACEILGQCILQHPLIRKDKEALKILYNKTGFNQIVKIAERLMPSLNKPGKKIKNASRNDKR